MSLFDPTPKGKMELLSGFAGPAAFSLRPVATSIRPAASAPSRVRSGRGQRLGAFVAVLVCAPFLVSGADAHGSPEPDPVPSPGAPLLKKSESGRNVRWRTADVNLVVDPTLVGLTDGAAEAAQAALAAWMMAGAELPSVSFSQASEAAAPVRDGVNRLMAGPIEIEGHRHDLALTVVYSDATTGDILEADIVLNTSFAYRALPPEGVEGCTNTYDVQSVVTHELGHFWGLGEDKDATSATMYYVTDPCTVVKRDLKHGDKEAIVTLYAEEPEEPGIACAAGAGARPTGGMAAAFGALVLALSRRRRTR